MYRYLYPLAVLLPLVLANNETKVRRIIHMLHKFCVTGFLSMICVLLQNKLGSFCFQNP